MKKRAPSVEEQYWEERYFSSGTSGEGSVGVERAWKWRIMDTYIPFLNNVLDLGCGDLSFWEGKDCEDYTGIDISNTIIEKNKINRPKWNFICANAENRITGLKKDIVLCFDVLFHILDDKNYLDILENLCYYSEDFILIHTWIHNPFSNLTQLKKIQKSIFQLKPRKTLNALKKMHVRKKVTDGKYQYYRKLNDDLEIFNKNDFNLIGVEKNPNGVGALYILKKR